MKKKLYIIFIGLIGFLSSCQKDETIVKILDNPIAPTIVSMPDLTLIRSNGLSTLEFVGTPVNPGFNASATYYLEACAAGNNFVNSTQLYSGSQDTLINITVSDLNGILLKEFPADAVSSIDFRIRATLTIDAGTGAPGTGSNPFAYSSEPTNASVTLYGLPRLDLIGSGISQKIESALGDGKYVGYVKLNTANPFTLKNPDTNTSYGKTGSALAVDGSAFPVENGNGWYKLTVDINALTFTLEEFKVGIIGSFTGWSAPDPKLDYNPQGGYWFITIDITAGGVKFRKNDGWDNGLNLGTGNGLTLPNLWNNGSSSDIPLTTGNYTIQLVIGASTYSCTFTKNS